MARCVHCDKYTAHPMQFNGGGPLCSDCHQARVQFAIAQGKARGIEPKGPTMKRGDIIEIQPDSRYARQWLVQGSAREPYKISLTKSSIWQCGCPAGRTTPGGMAADPCKHVMQVQIKFGYVGQIQTAPVTQSHGLQAEAQPTGRRFRD